MPEMSAFVSIVNSVTIIATYRQPACVASPCHCVPSGFDPILAVRDALARQRFGSQVMLYPACGRLDCSSEDFSTFE